MSLSSVEVINTCKHSGDSICLPKPCGTTSAQCRLTLHPLHSTIHLQPQENIRSLYDISRDRQQQCTHQTQTLLTLWCVLDLSGSAYVDASMHSHSAGVTHTVFGTEMHSLRKLPLIYAM